MSAAPDTTTRQYDIEIGPFTNPALTLPMTPAQTNLNYWNTHWMNGNLPLAFVFSKHRFTSQTLQSSEGEKSLWVINLSPIHFGALRNGTNQLANIDYFPVLPTGTITLLKWNQEYILQPQGHTIGVLIRPVDLEALDADGNGPMIDEVPIFNNWGGDPAKLLPEEAEMPELLSRLAALNT